MATSRHVKNDATQPESDDVVLLKEATPTGDVTKCTAYNDDISIPEDAPIEQTLYVE